LAQNWVVLDPQWTPIGVNWTPNFWLTLSC
jgi:hypothetical protein